MRIALYGNTCNNFYAAARALRESSDIDAHLYIDEGAEWMQLPESDEPALRGAYPPWIHRGPYRTPASRLWPAASPLARELRGYDLVLVSGHGVQLAPFVRRPFIFYATGWDLTVAPFPLRFLGRSKRPLDVLSALLNGLWQRQGIRTVSQVWSQPFAPFQTALRRLRVPGDKVSPRYFPIMLNTELFHDDPTASASSDPQIRRLVDGHDFIVFHPSRIMMDRGATYVDAGQWKGNDRLFEGFARFAKAIPGSRPVLALIDRELYTDRSGARRVIERLGISDKVAWLQAPHEYGFDRVQLLPFYSVADVVADEFATGWFGGVVIEGLAMSKPVLCYLDEAVMRTLYPWHPVLTPRSPEEITACLTALYRDRDERSRRGALGRKWVEEFHSLHGAAARYAMQLRSLEGRAAD